MIRWKGYSEAHDSWEPEDNVHTPDHLADFTQNHPKKVHDIGIKVATINDEPIIIQSISISPPTTTLTMSTPPMSQLMGEDQQVLEATTMLNAMAVTLAVFGGNSPLTDAPSSPRYIVHSLTPVPTSCKDEEEEIPRLSLLPPTPSLHELTHTPDNYHRYDPTNQNIYSFAITLGDSQIECMEFVRFLPHNDSPVIMGLTKQGEGPYGAPLIA